MDLDQEILSCTVMQHMYVRAPLEQALGIDIFENPGRQAAVLYQPAAALRCAGVVRCTWKQISRCTAN